MTRSPIRTRRGANTGWSFRPRRSSEATTWWSQRFRTPFTAVSPTSGSPAWWRKAASSPISRIFTQGGRSATSTAGAFDASSRCASGAGGMSLERPSVGRGEHGKNPGHDQNQRNDIPAIELVSLYLLGGWGRRWGHMRRRLREGRGGRHRHRGEREHDLTHLKYLVFLNPNRLLRRLQIVLQLQWVL